MKFITVISLLVINLVACNSYSEEVSQINTISERKVEKTPKESIDNNIQLEKINNNCIAILNVKGNIVSEIYLAGSKQEEYFLPCVKKNYTKIITTPTATFYVFSLEQVTPDNRYFTITRIIELKNNKLIDNIKASNLINGCFVENPVRDIDSIKELMLNITELENQCNSNTQRLKTNKTISLFDDEMKKTDKYLSASEIFYIIENKRVQGETWYKVDNESKENLWLSCKSINFC
ncbi:hypothetical protein [uncultured Psychrobacter sp.]|uniref:hypothetical protein n=1 Tax=uncultured Psychrobacter sp. TaxID=259303 RepID=UPI00260958A2|nr:hypothetical protein [uncultured Psychrobacter sp.]